MTSHNISIGHVTSDTNEGDSLHISLLTGLDVGRGRYLLAFLVEVNNFEKLSYILGK